MEAPVMPITEVASSVFGESNAWQAPHRLVLRLLKTVLIQLNSDKSLGLLPSAIIARVVSQHRLPGSGTDHRTSYIDSSWDIVDGISATVKIMWHSFFAIPDEPLTSQAIRNHLADDLCSVGNNNRSNSYQLRYQARARINQLARHAQRNSH